MLEDRKGYRLKREKESNFLRYFRQHRDNEAFTLPVRRSYKYSLTRFIEYLELTPQFSKYKDVLPMDAVTPDMVLGFTNYLRKKCTGVTGFDSKKLNTLYVDKNMEYHGLLQAFSRTNRVLNEKKRFGKIVCFRDLKSNVDKIPAQARGHESHVF